MNIIIQVWRYDNLEDAHKKQRQNEIEYCIKSHFENTIISKVHMLCNGDDIDYFKNKFPLGIYSIIEKQPTYKHFINYANTLEENSIICICNTDIEIGSFDLNILNKLDNNTIFALTRYETVDNNYVPFLISEYTGSHDTFIFKIPSRIDCSLIDFRQNIYGAENVFMNAFEISGYKVLNPCYQLKTYHHHKDYIYFHSYERINNDTNTSMSAPIFIENLMDSNHDRNESVLTSSIKYKLNTRSIGIRIIQMDNNYRYCKLLK